MTGASGFVGSAVLHRLLEAGFLVRALVRPGSPRDHLPHHGVRLVEGDIRDRESIRSAIKGARYVFHVAADYRLWARDRDEILATNISGTRIVMEEALRAGVERVIYTSSVATLAPRRDGAPAVESVSWPNSIQSEFISAARSPPSVWSCRWWRSKASRRSLSIRRLRWDHAMCGQRLPGG